MRAEAPNEHINDVRAIHYEKNLNPKTPEALYQMVPIAHPSAIQVVKKHPLWEDWYTISHEDFDRCQEFSWWSIFSVTGMNFSRPLTKKEAKIVDRRDWGGASTAKFEKQQESFREREAGDVAALADWVQTRTSNASSNSGG